MLSRHLVGHQACAGRFVPNVGGPRGHQSVRVGCLTTGDVHATIETLAKSSQQSGALATSLLTASNGLTEQSRHLKTELDSFLGSLHAA